MELYGNQIVPVLKMLNVSYSELARRMGVTQPNVSIKIKRDTWSCDDLQKVCDVLGIKYHINFFYNDGNKINESIIMNEPDYRESNITKRLNFILETLCITQSELADRLDIKQSNLSRKFVNNIWDIKNINHVCKALGIKYNVEYTYKNGDSIFDYSGNSLTGIF